MAETNSSWTSRNNDEEEETIREPALAHIRTEVQSGDVVQGAKPPGWGNDGLATFFDLASDNVLGTPRQVPKRAMSRIRGGARGSANRCSVMVDWSGNRCSRPTPSPPRCWRGRTVSMRQQRHRSRLATDSEHIRHARGGQRKPWSMRRCQRRHRPHPWRCNSSKKLSTNDAGCERGAVVGAEEFVGRDARDSCTRRTIAPVVEGW